MTEQLNNNSTPEERTDNFLSPFYTTWTGKSDGPIPSLSFFFFTWKRLKIVPVGEFLKDFVNRIPLLVTVILEQWVANIT